MAAVASDAFIAALDDCRTILASLSETVEGHMGTNPDALNWGHVGDANLLLSALLSAKEAANL